MRPRFLRDTVSIQPYNGSGSRGPTFGSAVTVKAAVQPESRLLVDTQGRELFVEVSVIINPGGTAFPVESKATLSDGRVFRVLRDEPQPDLARPTHRELWLGSLS